MKRIVKLSLISLTCLFTTSCSAGRQIDGYDNTEEKFNTNLFYRNTGEVQAADPHVISYDGKFYMYATNANSNGDCSYLQVWSSVNLTNWTNEGICYQPKTTNWSIDGLWAPEVIEHDGTFYLYYSGWDIKKGGHQIGVATSTSPIGPFEDYKGETANGKVDAKEAPIKFDFAVIDPSPFIDDNGDKYMLITQDQKAGVSSIYIAKLNDDMVTIDYSTVELLITPSLDFEKKSVTSFWNEAPFMYKKDGIYYLFYSTNYYMDRYYAVGVATSTSPYGPFVKNEEPLLMTQDYWDYISGTGHCSIFESLDKNETFIAYHSHIDTTLGGGERKINFDRIYFDNGKVYVNGPSLSPQILPSGSGEYGDITNRSSITVNGTLMDGLKDNFINAYEDKLENEVNLNSTNAEIKVTFENKEKVRAIMIYDSSNFDYSLTQIDNIKINNKNIKNIKMNEMYYGDSDYIFKIPVSAFIYEFDELETNEIVISVSSSENIYLNEIKVVGK